MATLVTQESILIITYVSQTFLLRVKNMHLFKIFMIIFPPILQNIYRLSFSSYGNVSWEINVLSFFPLQICP